MSSSFRSFVSSMIRKHRWLPAIATIVCTVALGDVLLRDRNVYELVGIAAALACASFVWGYSVRAFKVINYPSLLNLPRRQYSEVWDALAASPGLARAAASGHESENALRRSAETPVKNLIELAGVRSQDDILEFGCGVARIGFDIAPHCRTWTGADISANMLTCAAERLHGISNVRLVRLNHVGLDEFEENSFDLVYSTNMLAHLDEMDRWRYVKDAFRVLRPGGRLCIDNVDLESDKGWDAFVRGTETSQRLERPPYNPRFSTAAELTTYALRAAFIGVEAHKRSPLVIVTAIKPSIA